MHALPEEQQSRSMLQILGPYRHHQAPVPRSTLPAERFLAATTSLGVEIPALSADLIHKYIADLQRLKFL